MHLRPTHDVPSTGSAVALLLALVVVLATVVAAPADAATRARSGAELLAEDLVLSLHHQARANPGAFGHAGPSVPELTGWTDLREVARGWSDQQAAAGRMAHNPDFAEQVCCWTSVGENVAYIALPALDDASVERASRSIFQAWMDSDSHRRNILSTGFDQLGVGISITSSSRGYTMYLTTNLRKVTGTAPGNAYGTSGSGSTGSSAPDPAPYDTPACPDGEFTRGLFEDTLSGTHAGAVDCMAWWEIVTDGDASGDVFGTSGVATRGFMAAVIDRVAAAGGHPLPATSTDHFGDDDGHRYEAAIDRVVAAGIADGFVDGTFGPDRSLTRAQMATFLARVYGDWLELDTPRAGDHFDDDDGSVHEPNIDVVAAVDIAKGTGDRRFSPGRSLTRGQLASFAARTADHLVSAGVVPAGGA